MKIRTIQLWLAACVLCYNLLSCGNILDAKPDQSLLVPSKLSDYQAILDNFSVMNNDMPSLPNIAADDFVTTDNGWASLRTPMERNAYIWAEDVYENWLEINDWNKPYKQVYYANIVLDGLANLEFSEDENSARNLTKGRALFYRAYAFYQLIQTFAPAYNSDTAKELRGIPMKFTSDTNIPAEWTNLEEAYDLITKDIQEAIPLLEDEPLIHTRPSKVACYALLSRVNFYKSNYVKAEEWASKALAINGALLDYNTLSASTARPLPNSIIDQNDEVIFFSAVTGYSFMSSALTFVNPDLYEMYEDEDLRKIMFFAEGSEGYRFIGSYTGVVTNFSGISTNELYLTRAECRARAGDLEEARADMEKLLLHRYVKDSFNELDVEDEKLLEFILLERRKELIGRATRWADIKRLNFDSEFALTLKREVNGVIYTLAPNDSEYTFPYPAVELTGMENNFDSN